MKKISLFFSFFWCIWSVQAQGNLKFETLFHDFGQISGIQEIEYPFVLKNVGATPIRIRQVQSDCACLSSVHNSEAILPNASDTILVKYSPYRAGHFSKKFVVLTNGKSGAYELTIKGFIEPKSANKLYEFKYPKGQLLFKRKYLNFGTIGMNTPVSRKFEVYNPNDESVVFTGKVTTPEHIGLFFDSTHIVPPKETRFLVVTYDPTKQSQSGYLQESVTMFTKGEPNVAIPMTVSIHLINRKSRYSKKTKQKGKYSSKVIPKKSVEIKLQKDTTSIDSLSQEHLQKSTDSLQVVDTSKVNVAPYAQIRLSEQNQNLGDIYPNMTVSTEFEIFNDGAKPLEIEDIVGSKNCTIKKGIIEPIPTGKSRIIVVEIIQSVKKGEQIATFTIFSNDPKQPRLQGKILVNIVSEK